MSTVVLKSLIILIFTSLVLSTTPSISSDNKYCLENVAIEQFTKVSEKFYHFSENKASWFKAFLACRSLGAHLASFDTDEELSKLSLYLSENFGILRKWWISAADLNVDGEFHWYGTGKRFNYTSLQFRKPTSWKKVEQCGHLYYTNNRYHINDSKCKDEEYYLCDLDDGGHSGSEENKV